MQEAQAPPAVHRQNSNLHKLGHSRRSHGQGQDVSSSPGQPEAPPNRFHPQPRQSTRGGCRLGGGECTERLQGQLLPVSVLPGSHNHGEGPTVEAPEEEGC